MAHYRIDAAVQIDLPDDTLALSEALAKFSAMWVTITPLAKQLGGVERFSITEVRAKRTTGKPRLKLAPPPTPPEMDPAA